MNNRNVYIFHNPHKPAAVSFREELEKYVHQIGAVCCNDIADADLYVVIGGDGTLLNFSKRVLDHPKPVLAVNMGSLGFLTEVRVEDAFFVLKSFFEGNYSVCSRRFLELTINKKKFYALNDFVISKSGIHSRMVSVSVFSDGVFINTYRADGVIIATPTGSTAYSFSSGGPIVKPGLNALVITPIAAHNLNARPIVLPGDETIVVKPDSSEYELHVMLDGQHYLKLSDQDSLSMSLSDKKIDLIRTPRNSFYDILRQKLKWGDKLV
jgi:NAD+ kinase